MNRKKQVGSHSRSGVAREAGGSNPTHAADKRGTDKLDVARGAGAKKTRRQGTLLTKLLLGAGILLIAVAITIAVIVIRQYTTASRSYDEVATTGNVKVSDADVPDIKTLSVDWAALRAVNPDIVGWIMIPGTEVNYPIVQAEDNDYYLYNLFEGSYSKAGSIFLDYENSPNFTDQNNVIYGHNLIDGSMFACIADYADQTFFDEHSEILLATPERNYRLKAAFAYVCNGSDVGIRQTNFAAEDEFHTFVDDLIGKASASSVTSSSGITSLYSLVTCSYQHDDARTVLCLTPVEVVDAATSLSYTTSSKIGTDYATDKSAIDAAATEGSMPYLNDLTEEEKVAMAKAAQTVEHVYPERPAKR